MALLALRDVDARYGQVQALRGVTLTVDEGEIVAILGANGAGKTTTLRSISGTVRRTGTIELGGRSLARSGPEQAARLGVAHVPEGRLVPYGHVGDGNLHFNISQLPGGDRARFLARAAEIRRAIHDLVREFGGSFSAEHGVGRTKVGELERYASPVELELMRAVKHAFDPHGIMNPGKVLREE